MPDHAEAAGMDRSYPYRSYLYRSAPHCHSEPGAQPGVGTITGRAALHNREDLTSLVGSASAVRSHRPDGVVAATDGDRADLALIRSLVDRHGPSILNRLRGPFSFVLERPDGSIVCGRDQLGLYPLYYAVDGDTLIVSDDMTRVLDADTRTPQVDDVTLTLAIGGFWRDVERTVWSTVKRLPAGHYIIQPAGHRARQPVVTDYWAPQQKARVDHRSSRDDHATALGALIDQAVRRACEGQVVATELSGGYDSSTVTGFAATTTKAEGGQITAFTMVAPDVEGEDEPCARSMVDQHQLDWVRFAPITDLAPAIERARRWSDLPGAFLGNEIEWVARQASDRGATTLLTGQVGDAVLRGTAPHAVIGLTGRGALGSARTFAGGTRQALTMARHVLVGQYPLTKIADRFRPIRGWSLVRPEAAEAAGLTTRVADPGLTRPHFGARARLNTIRDPFTQRQFELTHRVGEEAGITIAHPLMDVDLIEYAATIPADHFFVNGNSRGLHAASANTVLSPQVAGRRTKDEFSPVARRMLKENGAEAMLASSWVVERGLVDPDVARARLAEAYELGAAAPSAGPVMWELVGWLEAETFHIGCLT